MRTLLICVVAAVGLGVLVLAQTRVSLKNQGRDFDLSGGQNVRPVPVITTLPATCATGEMVFKSNAVAGQNLYACVSTNVWLVQGMGSAGMQVARTSPTTLLIGADCTAGNPCRARFGAVVYLIAAPATLTLNSGSGSVFVYISEAGIFTVAATPASGLSLSCDSNCQVAANTNDFPVQSIPLWTWTASSNAWDGTGDSDRRATISAGRRFVAGTNIAIVENGSSVSIASTNFLPAGSVVNGGAIRFGAAIPATASDSLLGVGSAITGGSAEGTAFGVHTPSGFAGDVAHWQANGQSLFRWTTDGGFAARQSGATVNWWGNDDAASNSSFRLAVRGTDASNTLALGTGTAGTFLVANGLGRVALGTMAAVPGTADLLVQDATPSSGSTQMKLQAGEGQNRDLLQLLTYGGTVTAKITAEGALAMLPSGTRPACSSATRGMFWFTAGGAGVADQLEVCAKGSNDLYQWNALY